MQNNGSKIFVGMLVMTKLKLFENSPEELVAILQRRGKIESENGKGFKWQKFSGLCEVTSYGKAEEGESWEQALEREMNEELGNEVATAILKSERKIIHKITEDDGDEVTVCVCLLPADFLNKLKLEVSTGGIEIITRGDLNKVKYFRFGTLENITSTDLNEIIITTLPIEKLKESFEIFG
ncbi:MAG: NUDIX domain-containing protein [Candidatus Paceibacterota bacterium]|jgi:hypothetical protein